MDPRHSRKRCRPAIRKRKHVRRCVDRVKKKSNKRRSARPRSPRRACPSYSSCSHFDVPLNVPKNLQKVKFITYIKRVLRKIEPNLSINSESVHLVDNLIKDTLHQIAMQAGMKMGRRKVLKPKILFRALKKVIPKSMVTRVDEQGQKALDRFQTRSRRR